MEPYLREVYEDLKSEIQQVEKYGQSIESEGSDGNIFATEGMSCCLDQIFLFDPTLTVCIVKM